MECYAKYMAIIAIMLLTVYALYLGHNGAMFAGVIAVIGGLAGYEAGIIKGKKK